MGLLTKVCIGYSTMIFNLIMQGNIANSPKRQGRRTSSLTLKRMTKEKVSLASRILD